MLIKNFLFYLCLFIIHLKVSKWQSGIHVIIYRQSTVLIDGQRLTYILIFFLDFVLEININKSFPIYFPYELKSIIQMMCCFISTPNITYTYLRIKRQFANKTSQTILTNYLSKIFVIRLIHGMTVYITYPFVKDIYNCRYAFVFVNIGEDKLI